MERHHGVPMPAGSLVPRRPLQIINPFCRAMTPKNRARFAVRALEATFGCDAVTKVNVVAPNYLHACEEWATAQCFEASWEPGAALDIYKAFCVVADEDPDRLVHVLHTFSNRLEDRQRPDRQRAAEHSMTRPGDPLDTGSNESTQASVDLVLAHADGRWQLLSLLFLNLLNTNLGLPSAKIYSLEMAESQNAPARQLLAAWGADATSAGCAVSDDLLAARVGQALTSGCSSPTMLNFDRPSVRCSHSLQAAGCRQPSTALPAAPCERPTLAQQKSGLVTPTAAAGYRSPFDTTSRRNGRGTAV